MPNLISAILDLKDNFSPKVRDAISSMDSAILKGNLMSSALTGAFNMATSAVGNLSSAILDASQANNSVILTAGAMANIIESDFDGAHNMLITLNSDLASLSATLPGSTEGYTKFFNSIADDVAIVNKEMNGGIFNAEQYSDQIGFLTSRFNILADQPGLNFGQGVSAFQSILGGQSIDSMEKLEFFRSNPAFLNALKQAEISMGKTFEEMTSPERLKAMESSLSLVVSDESIAKLSGSLDSMIQGLQTSLFNKDVGLFGVNRDLFKSLEGQQTLVEQLTVTVSRIFGSDNSLLSTMQGIFTDLGMSLDPMVTLYNFIGEVNEQLLGVTGFAKEIGNFFKFSDLETGLSEFKGIIGNKIREVSTFFAENFNAISTTLFRGFYDGVVLAIDGLFFTLSNINWGSVGINVASAFGESLSYALAPENLGNTLKIAALAGLAVAAPVVVGAVAAAFAGIPAAALAITAGVTAAYIQNWDSVVLGVQYTFQQIGSAVLSIGGDAIAWVGGKMESIRTGIVEFFDRFEAMWQRLADAVTAAMNAIQNIATFPMRAITNPIGTAQNIITQGNQLLGGSRFDGQVPNASDGFLNSLLGAVARESQAMPPGSRIVVANSSEAILNRAQQAALATGVQPIAVPGNIGQLIVNVSEAQKNPKEIAQQVMSEIAASYETWKSSQLSSIVS